MNKKHVFLAAPSMLVLMAISYYSCVKDQGVVKKTLCDSLITYSTVIKPIIVTNCAQTSNCHDGSGISAPLDLNTYADLKTFFDNGQLKSRVFTLKDMPPSPAVLPDSLLKKINCWMNSGAPNN